MENKRRRERKKRDDRKKNPLSSKRLLQIIAVLLALVVLQSCAEYWVPPTYRYKVVHVGHDIEAVLDEHSGWELHQITGTIHSARSAVLKKRGWFIERFF